MAKQIHVELVPSPNPVPPLFKVIPMHYPHHMRWQGPRWMVERAIRSILLVRWLVVSRMNTALTVDVDALMAHPSCVQ